MADSSFYDDPQRMFESIGGSLPKPPSFPSPAEVELKAGELSKDIFAQWNILNNILLRHEATLRKRWMKKIKEQRKKLLLSAWPNMPPTHRPDFQALRKESSQQRMSGTNFKDAFNFPHVNLEDLCQVRPLLLFLNSRGRHLPHVFAHVDDNVSQIGVTSGAIRRPFLNGYTMLLHNQKTQRDYGRLVSWDDDGAFQLMFSGIGFQPGEGLLILEKQKRTWDFLVRCCQLILHDLPQDSLTDGNIPIEDEPPAILPTETSYRMLVSTAIESPYRVPAQLDLEFMKQLIGGKKRSAADHVFALREDPSYFANTVRDLADHRQETLLDTNGNNHPHHDDAVFWDRVLNEVVSMGCVRVMLWDIVDQQVAEVDLLRQKYAAKISPDKGLPSEYEKALQSLRYFFYQCAKIPISLLQKAVPASPPIRSRFVREPQEPSSTIIKFKTKSSVGDDPLLRSLRILWDEDQLLLHGLPNVVDELERLMQYDPAQKARVSPWVADVFSDLAGLGECLRQLNLYQPWASTFENNADEHVGDDYARASKGMVQFWQDFMGVPSLAHFGAPYQQRFQYPANKPRTAKNVKAMREAERNLDLFWSKIDQHLDSKPGNAAYIWSLQKSEDVQRTPEWSEPEPKAGEVRSAIQDIVVPVGRLPKEPGTSQPNVETKQPAREKIKTRGVTGAVLEKPDDNEAIPDRAIDRQPTFEVGRRAFKVFLALFHIPSLSDPPGEVSWTDFLHAMAGTGFKIEQLYGSAWQFTPTKLDVESSIIFHQPHPSGKIPFLVARRHGRRLHRTYGWKGDMFKLA